MRFLANENFPLASVVKLRQAGYDVAAIIEDMPGAKDTAVLVRANLEERIVLTFDRDYGELVYSKNKPAPAGVIYFRFDPLTPEEPAIHLLDLINLPNLIFEQRFTVTDRRRLRQRPLPKR
jgi:predicted nuclease of predicted toxin-antitoxin system